MSEPKSNITKSLFQPHLIDPLPLEVAKAWHFHLSHIIRQDGVYLFNLRQWLAGCVDEQYATKAIQNLRADNYFSRVEIANYTEVDEKTTDGAGRPAQEIYVTDTILYRLTQDIRSTSKRKTSTAVDAIKDYLAHAGAFIDRQRVKADKKRIEGQVGYQLQGRSMTWSVRRMDTRDTFKELMAQVARVTDDKRAYGMVTNEEYVELVGKTTRELRDILQTEHVRDALPELTLTYIKTAEETLTALLSHSQRMTVVQLQAAVIKVVKPLGELLKAVCEDMGIDPVIDMALLPQGKQTKLIGK